MTDTTLHPSDAKAIDAVVRVKPAWHDLKPAAEAIGLGPNIFLHAGPAFASPAAITQPVLNSAVIAALFEGLAKTMDEAEVMVRSGRIELKPAQDFEVVTPLATVVSRSMQLHVVADLGEVGRLAYAPINEGSGPATRLGQRTQAVLDLTKWLNGEFAQRLARAMDGPLPLIPLAFKGLSAGDDCHGRTPAASAALALALAPRLGQDEAGERARKFLAAGPSFFLNLWMAACKCMLEAAIGTKGSSLVTAAGANGLDTGIQVAGLTGRWFTAAAEPPRGQLMAGLPASRALPAIGDSAIVDALGFGAMAMSVAPEQQKALSAFMPEGGMELPGLLLAATHPDFKTLGLRVGLTGRAVVTRARRPVVSLGILDQAGTEGRLGGGIYQPPLDPFQRAVAALEGQA